MSRFRFLSTAAIAIVSGLAFTSGARADLWLRITSFDSTGTVIDASQTTQVAFSPPGGPTGIVGTYTLAGAGFTLNILTNTSFSGGVITDHGFTFNISRGTSGTSNLFAASNQLTIEYFGSGYVNPTGSPPPAIVSTNASPSTSGLTINSINLVSGVFNGGTSASTIAGVVGAAPQGVGAIAGILGATTQTGTAGGGASSVMTPNPATGAEFSLANPFSFYQVFRMSGFGTGTATMSGGSFVTNVPEPATIVGAMLGLPVLGVWMRRRRNAANALSV